MRRVLLLAALAAGCSPHHAPAPKPPGPLHYVVGGGYRAGGVWHYPREEFRYDSTGLAERLPDREGLTADGEAFDATALAGAHPTLQLPAIVRVTNLETGRQVLVRLNDRGPGRPGRMLGLTRRAADLLQLPAAGAARVRVQVEDEPSQALRDALQGNVSGMVAAPRAAVAATALPPPPGTGQSARRRVAGAPPPAGPPEAAVLAPPLRLPERVTLVPAQPGALWIQAGTFGRAEYANRVKAKLYALPARVRRLPGAGAAQFAVEAGPFADTDAADAALDRALAAGVTDAQIAVE